MTDEQKNAYVLAMVACANAKVSGMIAENTRNLIFGAAPKYGLADFELAIAHCGITHNQVMDLFRS